MGKPAPEKTLEEAEKAIWEELALLTEGSIDENELEKVKNRYESEQIFNNLNYLNVATNLAYFELIGKAEDINTEVENTVLSRKNRLREQQNKHFCLKIVPYYIIKLPPKVQATLRKRTEKYI